MKNKVISYLRPLFFRTFDIREGEFVRARLMLLQIFLLISSLLVIKPAVNALFLANFGARKLPLAFVIVALSAALVSTIYSRILTRFPLNKIIIRTILFSVISFIVFGILLKLNFLVGVVLYLFYIWISIFAVLSASQFWILANVVFNSREAKRLFGFIGAGAIAGGIFGGYFASILASLIGSENLVFGGALLLALSIPVTKRIWKNHVVQNETSAVSTAAPLLPRKRPLRLILGSRHLSFLALIIAVSVIVAKLVEYQYSAIAAAKITDPDELTAFFGLWFSNFNVISLLIQLFLTRRVVGVFGVGISLLFLPVAIMIGAVFLLFFPELWAAILIKMADGSLKQSINKSANELLALPIPADIKKHTKSFIDVFVDSAATGISGLILLFVVIGLNLPTGVVSSIIILLLILWIYLAVQVRKEYLKQFRAKIAEFQGAPGTLLDDLENQSILDSIREIFLNGNADQIVYMLRKVNEIRDERLIDDIFQLVSHSSNKVRLEALRNLYYLNARNYAEEIRPLTGDPDESIRIAAFEYLAEHLNIDSIEELTGFLEHPDSEIRQSALIALATESKGNSELQKKLGILDLIREKRNRIESQTAPEKAIRTQKVILKAIGAGHILSLYDFILSNLQSPQNQLVFTAIESGGFTLDPMFIRPLFNVMQERRYREKAQEALQGYGSALFNHLPYTEEEKRAWGAEIHLIPQILDHINSQKSVDYLFSLLEFDQGKAEMEALEGLMLLKTSFPELSFSEKLIKSRIKLVALAFHDALSLRYQQDQNRSQNSEDQPSQPENPLNSLLGEYKIRQFLDKLFRYMGLLYGPQELLGVYQAICSDDAAASINAIEFLDTLLDPRLKRLVIPILEASMAETVTKESLNSLDINHL